MIKPIAALPLERRIWLIRGQRVMLDSDLAEIYGVPTKRLNEQVKRNADRFPPRYAFRLTAGEAREILRSQNATLGWGDYRKHPPLAFTEHGAVMLASVLRSKVAVAASLRVVDAFVRLRALVAQRDGLGRKLEALERRVADNTGKIDRIFDVLNDLLAPSGEPNDQTAPPRKIGFRPE